MPIFHDNFLVRDPLIEPAPRLWFVFGLDLSENLDLEDLTKLFDIAVVLVDECRNLVGFVLADDSFM